MIFIYDASLRLYHGIISMLRFFHPKAKHFAEGRKQSFRQLKDFAAQQHSKTWWFHCASLGEFEQARPLMELMKRHDPQITIALSFFSPSGYLYQSQYAYAEVVFYLPRDSKKHGEQLLTLINPKGIVFVKYEFWLHYIQEAASRRIPIYLISALFRSDQIFFKGYGGVFRDVLKKFTKIFVQDLPSGALLDQINIAWEFSGDTRFDRVLENKSKAKAEPLIERFKEDKKILLLGSSWSQEEKLLFRIYDGGYKVIIAPHDIHRNISIPEKFKSAKLSEADPRTIETLDVLVIDSIGKLSSLYQYCDIAFVGGGFRGALHNILEAAVFGIPVLYGPETKKHPEAELLAIAGGGIIVANEEELREQIAQLFADAQLLRSGGACSEAFIKSHSGATQKIANALGLR